MAMSTYLLKEFLPVAKNLSDRAINQGGTKHMLLKQIEKAFNRHPDAFQNYHIMDSDTVNKTAAI